MTRATPSPSPGRGGARRRQALAILALAALAGCSAGTSYDRLQPPPGGGAAPRAGTPGIVAYDSYEAAVAREGETVAQIGQRVGISGAELGAYNGLQPGTVLRAGDELVLPPRAGGYGGVRVAEVLPPTTPTTPVTTTPTAPLDPNATVATVPPTGQIESGALGTPVAGEAVVAAASPGTNPGATPGAQTDGSVVARDGSVWSPSLAAAAIDDAGTESTAAATATAPPPDTPTIEGAIDGTQAGANALPEPPTSSSDPVLSAAPTPREGDLSRPPSANEPLPPAPVETARPASPDLGQYQSPTPELTPETEAARIEQEAEEADRAAAAVLASAEPSGAPDLGIRFVRPVQGPVAVPYNVSTTGRRNEGVDFAAPAGAQVRAAAPGEVALVSQSLGGLGTIVLIRHRDDILTVYGRVSGVSVAKGERVQGGQPIGVVAQGDGSSEPRMHFEIRRGADSLNPSDYLGG
ncbi:MAG: peptidoglycan DD-metalloendopeptidase family protein [Pseudomonadota bacterium]